MKCLNCVKEITDEFAKYCPECGVKLPKKEKKCPSCGNILSFDDKFCNKCGASLDDSEIFLV